MSHKTNYCKRKSVFEKDELRAEKKPPAEKEDQAGEAWQG